MEINKAYEMAIEVMLEKVNDYTYARRNEFNDGWKTFYSKKEEEYTDAYNILVEEYIRRFK